MLWWRYKTGSKLLVFFSNYAESESIFFGIQVTHVQLRSNYLIVMENKTWDQARETCLSKGYYLLYIESALENMYMDHLLHTYTCEFLSNGCNKNPVIRTFTITGLI